MNTYFIRIIVFLFSTIIVLIAAMIWSKNFLSYHHPVNSDNFLLEGWLTAWDIEQSVEVLREKPDAKIFIVGRQYKRGDVAEVDNEKVLTRKDGILLLTNSSLILKPEVIQDAVFEENPNLIVEAKGSSAFGIFAHFLVLVNGEKRGSFFSSSELETFHVSIPHPDTIKSISILYDNDLATDVEARYLVVKSVQIGNRKIELMPVNVIVTRQEIKALYGFPSSAALMKNYLHDLGVDPSIIQTIPFQSENRNQTLEGCQAFSKWPGSQKIKSFNIVSQEIHSRRSWMTYSRILSDTDVGVIYFKPRWKEIRQPEKRRMQHLKVFDEIISYMGNWFYLSFLYE